MAFGITTTQPSTLDLACYNGSTSGVNLTAFDPETQAVETSSTNY